MTQRNMIHQRLHAAIHTADTVLKTAKHTPIVTLLAMTIARFLLDMALGQENPLIPDSTQTQHNARVHDVDLFILLGRVWRAENSAFERARHALPDLLVIVHAEWLGADREAFLHVFADRPCAFAEAPVIVGFAGAPGHHALLPCGAAFDRGAAERGHA